MSTKEIAIRCEGLSKRYSLDPHADIQPPLTAARSALRRLLGKPADTIESPGFWALDDLSFTINHGEVVGIIGRNGAGKSTLLRILSKITKPTRGQAHIWGRVGSLLEVGTGFNPELSGRDNVFLNGTILGLSREEIRKRFDEIVAFAEVESFIDMAVKRYSSGMQVRLAFAVAAHLNPDILILDEVLTVGDAGFQKKCLQRMESDTLQGRTVLLVSHSLPSVISFCSRCLWLENGRLMADGPPKEVTTRYLEAIARKDAAIAKASSGHAPPVTSEAALVGCAPEIADAIRRGEHYGDGTARVSEVRISAHEPQHKEAAFIQTGDDICIEVDILAVGNAIDTRAAIVVFDPQGTRLIDASTEMKGELLQMQPGDQATVRFVLQNVLLKPDTYRVSVELARRGITAYDGIPSAATFSIHINPELMEGFQIYPAVYQCRFFHEIDYPTATGKQPIVEG